MPAPAPPLAPVPAQGGLKRIDGYLRLAFALLIGVMIGTVQLVAILVIESSSAGPSGIHSSDAVYPFFALLVCLEVISVMALCLYRVVPWVLRMMNAEEERRVLESKARHHAWIWRVVVCCMMLRRAIVMLDAGLWSLESFVSLAVALACLLVPLPKDKPADGR